MEKVWLFATIALDVFPFIFLQYLPFLDKLKLPYKKVLWISTAVLSVQFLGFVWLAEQPFCTSLGLLYYRFGLLLTLCVLTLIFIRDSYAKVFFVFSLMAPYVVVVISGGNYWGHLVKSPEMPPYMASALCRMGIIAVSFLPLYLLAKKYLLPAMKIDDIIWRYALPVPVMFSLISLSFVHPDYEINGVPPGNLLGMLFIFFGCIFTCFFLLKALNQVQQNTRLAEREVQSQWLLRVQAGQFDALSKSIGEARVARHDLRHILAVIKQLAQQDNKEKLGEFVNKLVVSAAEPKPLVIGNNPVLSGVAGHYRALGQEKGIVMDFLFTMSDKGFCDDIDLCIILGNLLENAIEACQKLPESQRFIKLRAKMIADNFSLTVDNSFDGLVLTKEEEYLSRKSRGGAPAGSQKGLGLASVAAVVEKYGGVMKVEHTENLFMVSLLLPGAQSEGTG